MRGGGYRRIFDRPSSFAVFNGFIIEGDFVKTPHQNEIFMAYIWRGIRNLLRNIRLDGELLFVSRLYSRGV